MRYDIVALIRRKIVFKDRPKPLIAEENRGIASSAVVFCVWVEIAPPYSTNNTLSVNRK